jgi:hypothetical protein
MLRYVTAGSVPNPDTGLRLFISSENADAGLTFFSVLISDFFQRHTHNTPSSLVRTCWVYPFSLQGDVQGASLFATSSMNVQDVPCIP